MKKLVFKNTVGSEGLFTFNFFCESLIGAMHTLLHAMQDSAVEPPETLGRIPDSLSAIGTNLMNDYEQKILDFDRIKQEMLDFYELAYEVSDAMVPIVARGNDEVRYYYFIFEQGIKIMFPTLLENLVDDLPEDIDAVPFIEKIMDEFAAASMSE